jgi:hypothetical protein
VRDRHPILNRKVIAVKSLRKKTAPCGLVSYLPAVGVFQVKAVKVRGKLSGSRRLEGNGPAALILKLPLVESKGELPFPRQIEPILYFLRRGHYFLPK